MGERIVMGYWEKTVMYLHVETKNKAAQHLYINMGYEPAEIKVPKWQRLSLIFSLFSSLSSLITTCFRSMLGLDDILYFKKHLISSNNLVKNESMKGMEDDDDESLQLLGLKKDDDLVVRTLMSA